ncbi:MAG: ATP-binding cassette domain-containing protein, partial [Acidimicrobiales bacterium]|nr:ATP-binding cassette domain-containing protein [Acidimicrobiales bacterium]
MGEAGLVVEGLSKRFGDIVALDGCDLQVPNGQLVGFLGPNGAGKTTAMRAVVGLVSYDSGTLRWDGADLDRRIRARIGYLPQQRGMYPRMRVHEHVAYIARLAGLDRPTAAEKADEWVERVGLTERRDDLIQELSIGNQQRVQLAVALVHEPLLVVLDEPFAGLDPVAVSTLSGIMTDLAARGVSVVFSSHQLDLVQDLCETVTIIARGRTRATGTVRELRGRSEHRILEVTWAGRAPAWAPRGGRPLTPRADGATRFELPTPVDVAAVV